MGLTVLLDTHALLWGLLEPHRLSPTALDLIKDPGTMLLVSSASAWELSIKHRLGKLAGAENVLNDFTAHLQRLQADILVITPEHALKAGALPLHHRDPFDRMLVAQAMHEHVPIITSDPSLHAYSVPVIW